MDTDEGTVPRNGSIVPVTPGRPTVADLHGENPYAQLARKNWTNLKKAPKVRQAVVRDELWEPLDREGFPYPSLLILENLQLLEKYRPVWFNTYASS